MAAGPKGESLEINYYSKITQGHFANREQTSIFSHPTDLFTKGFLYESVTSYSVSKPEPLDTKDIVL